MATIARVDFRIAEIVWAKIRGFNHWPARVKSFPNSKKVLVVWLNDYRITNIYRTQCFKFLVNFEEFAKKIDQSIGLRCAAQEGLILFGQQQLANK